MLDISGDRGVLKDVIREGAGDLVAPDASVLGVPWGGLSAGSMSSHSLLGKERPHFQKAFNGVGNALFEVDFCF